MLNQCSGSCRQFRKKQSKYRQPGAFAPGCSFVYESDRKLDHAGIGAGGDGRFTAIDLHSECFALRTGQYGVLRQRQRGQVARTGDIPLGSIVQRDHHAVVHGSGGRLGHIGQLVPVVRRDEVQSVSVSLSGGGDATGDGGTGHEHAQILRALQVVAVVAQLRALGQGLLRVGHRHLTDDQIVELAHSAHRAPLIGADVGSGVQEVAGQVALLQMDRHVLGGGHPGQVTALVLYVQHMNGHLEVGHVHARLVAVHKLQNRSISGNQLGIADIDHRGRALHADAGLASAEGGVENIQHGVVIVHHHRTEAAAGDLAAIDDVKHALALHAHEQDGEAEHVHPGVVVTDVVVADAERAVAVAARAGQGEVAVLDHHVHWIIGTVDAEQSPAIALHDAVLIAHLRTVTELRQPVESPEADRPGERADPVLAVRADVEQAGVFDHHLGSAAHLQQAAGHAGEVKAAVVHGELDVVNGGQRRAQTQPVVVAIAFQIKAGIGDAVLGVAVEDDAVEILLAGGHIEPIGLIVAHGGVLQDGRHSLLRDELVVGDHGGLLQVGLDLVDHHQAVGTHVVGRGNGDDDVAPIGTGFNGAAAAVHGQGQELPLRRDKLRSGLDGQLVEMIRLVHPPRCAGFHDLVQQHGISSLWF